MSLRRKKPLQTKGSTLKRTPFVSKKKKTLTKTVTPFRKSKETSSEEGRAWDGLMRTTGLSRGTKPMNRGTKTLARSAFTIKRNAEIANPAWSSAERTGATGLKRATRFKIDGRLVREAKKFHDEVWAMFGDRCVLCTRREPAQDAAHVLKRSMLGKLRYADPRFARPAHHECHVEQEENRLRFPLAIRLDAVRAYNKITKNTLLPEPVE